MPTTLDHIRKEKAWQRRYNALAPRPGDLAPDFELWDTLSAQRVRLSDFRRQQPVALVFGSFT
jgi:hypothetical protein